MSEFIDFRARVVRGVDGETTLYFFSADGRRAGLSIDQSHDGGGVVVSLVTAGEALSFRELDSDGGLDPSDVEVALREMAEFCHETSVPAAVDRDAVLEEAARECAWLETRLVQGNAVKESYGAKEAAANIRALKSQPAKEPR